MRAREGGGSPPPPQRSRCEDGPGDRDGERDRDGDKDVLVVSQDDNSVFWYRNDGTPADGGFNKYVINSALSGAYSAQAADIDGDGDLDVVATGSSENDVVWYANDGSPAGDNWTETIIDADFDRAKMVRAIDLDGDGDKDVVAVSDELDDVSWWLNDGSPGGANWTEYSIDNNFNGAVSVNAADFDGDGDIDVIAGSNATDGLRWWMSDGTPTAGWSGSRGRGWRYQSW